MKKLVAAILLMISIVAWADAFEDGVRAYIKEDYKTALKKFEPLAKQGNAKAQFNLAVMYIKGQGVVQDYKQAVRWYTLAAEQGDADAQFDLGVMYSVGQGVVQDAVKAHMWMIIAAANRDKKAQENRDDEAPKMTTKQIERAQQMARNCLVKNYKQCN
jgi:uncharacterized protein